MTRLYSSVIDIGVFGHELRYFMEMAENGRIISGDFKVHFCTYAMYSITI